MGTYTFRLPDIGEGIAAAEIVAWHVAIGDRVEEDSPLADMMTDKATVEMESPVAGRVIALAGAEGDMVAIGAPLVVLEVEGGGEDEGHGAPGPGAVAAVPAAPALPEGPAMPEPAVNPDPPRAPEPPIASAVGAAEVPAVAASARVLASPAVRARARDLGVDLAQVRPAEDGRVRHADLDAFLAYNDAFRAPGGARPDQQVKVMGLRRRIAEAMSEAKRHIPHFTYVEECDVTALEEMRAQLNGARPAGVGEAGAGEPRPKLTLLPFLIVAMCRTLPQFPMLNARFDDAAGVVTRHGAVHCGVAAQTDAGLMVPVIRDAQSRNLWQLAAEIARLAEAARSGTALSQELSGSTITISSLGPLGGIASTPVINRPEVAILAPNRIVERPMFVPDGMGGERVAKRKLMNLSISCDHRVIDGWDAASFVQALRRLLETPVLLLAD